MISTRYKKNVFNPTINIKPYCLEMEGKPKTHQRKDPNIHSSSELVLEIRAQTTAEEVNRVINVNVA